MTNHTALLWHQATFRECWVGNFEFFQPPGEKPAPRCFTAIEKFSGRTVKLARDDLVKLTECPFDIGPDTVFASYSVVAEIACFLALGWKLPHHVLCLYAEHRNTTNGLILPFGNNLTGALAHRGSAHLTDKSYQDKMNRRAQDPTPFSAPEEAAMIEHCWYNTKAALRLLDVMAPTIKWQRARFMGQFSTAVARIERRGTPLAIDPVRCVIENRKTLVQDLVAAVDAHLGVYDGITYKRDRMAALIERKEWRGWPLQPDGIWPAVNKEVLEMMESLYPGEDGEIGTVADFRQLRATISQLRDVKLAIGQDGRNRASLMPFATKTGRCAPSTTGYIWGVAKWMRRLIQPQSGRALGHLDFAGEEFLIASAVTGDERMAEVYASRDPYIGTGIALGLAPPGATAESHPAVRKLMKVLVLGLGYGMKAHGLQRRTGLPLDDCKDIMRKHKRVFHRFWGWIDAWMADALASGRMTTPLGWEMRIRGKVKDNTIQNWPIQSTAADVLQLATIAAEDAGIQTCALIHDAVLIEAPVNEIEDAVAEMRDVMIKAGRTVFGADLRIGDPQIVRPGQRFYDKDGEPLYRRVTALLPEIALAPAELAA